MRAGRYFGFLLMYSRAVSNCLFSLKKDKIFLSDEFECAVRQRRSKSRFLKIFFISIILADVAFGVIFLFGIKFVSMIKVVTLALKEA